MDRRRWLRNAAILTAGTIAADQIDLPERLTWQRTLFPGANFALPPGTYTFDIETYVRGDDLVMMKGIIRPNGQVQRLKEVSIPFTMQNIQRSRALHKLLEAHPLPNNQRFDLEHLRSRKLIVQLDEEKV